MDLENQICALLNIKSEYIKDKFKDVYLTKKRESLYSYLLSEFGAFDYNKCKESFNRLGFYSIDRICLYSILYSTFLSMICCSVSSMLSINGFICWFLIIFFIFCVGVIYAK